MPTPEEVRAELVRSRGFIRGAETQLTKSIELMDQLIAAAPAPAPEPEPPPPAPVEELVAHATWPVAGSDAAAITSGLPGVRINQAGPALTGGVPTLAVLEPGALAIRKNGTYGHFIAQWPRQPAAGECWGYSYELENEPAQTDAEQHMGCLCEIGHIHFAHTAMLPPPGVGGGLVGGAWEHGLRRLYWSHLAGDVRVEARSGVQIAGGQRVTVQGVLEWLSPETFRAWPRLLDTASGIVLAEPGDYVLTDQSGARLVDWYAQGRTLRRNTANPDPESIRDFSVGAAQNDGSPSGAHYRVANLRLGYRPGPQDWLAP